MGDEIPSSKSTHILDNIRGILFHAEETTSIAMTLLLRFISKSTEALNKLKVIKVLALDLMFSKSLT